MDMPGHQQVLNSQPDESGDCDLALTLTSRAPPGEDLADFTMDQMACLRFVPIAGRTDITKAMGLFGTVYHHEVRALQAGAIQLDLEPVIGADRRDMLPRTQPFAPKHGVA